MDKSSPAPPLEYMPLRFHRQKREAWKFVYLFAIAATGFGGFDWLHPHETVGVIIAQGTVLVLLASGAVIASILKWAVECRIEGSTLTIQNPPLLMPICVQIDDITEIVTLIHPENSNQHELAVHGLGRINVGPELFTPLEPLKIALLEMNPRIIFSQRPILDCHACGYPRMAAATSFYQAMQTAHSGKCTKCGQAFSKRSRFI